MKRYICLLLFLAIFSAGVLGQANNADDEEVVVEANVMSQVVKRILVWKFKPRKKPTTIYVLKEGIDPAWLPKIQNIHFQLITDEEALGEIYFFKKPELSGNSFEIGFGFGDPSCRALGDMWRFRLSGTRVRLWHNGTFGMGCRNWHSSPGSDLD